MKLFIVTAIFLALVTPSTSSQSGSSSNRDQTANSEHDKKAQKAKPNRQKEVSNKSASDRSTKTPSRQDAAYAVAYKAGTPK